jgi:hypothetical protein
MRDNEMMAESLRRITERGVLPGQKYKHYNTNDVYVVVAVGLNEPDLEPLVHYRIAADEYATIWTRHLDIFCGRARQGDVFVSRYERVE